MVNGRFSVLEETINPKCYVTLIVIMFFDELAEE
jgi:hypothetical protein